MCTKHIISHIGNGFCGSNDPTDSVKALKEVVVLRIGFNPTRSTSPRYNTTHACNTHWYAKYKNESKHSEMEPVEDGRTPQRYLYCIREISLSYDLLRRDLVIIDCLLLGMIIGIVQSQDQNDHWRRHIVLDNATCCYRHCQRWMQGRWGNTNPTRPLLL